MAKKNIKCGHCGKPYSTSIIKVYVIKERKCPNCKETMFSDNKLRVHSCPKCGKKVGFDEPVSLGCTIIDVTVDYHKRDKYITMGKEIDKKEEPSMQVCKQCANLRSHIENLINKDPTFSDEVKRDLKALSNIEFMDAFFKNIQPAMRRRLSARPKEITSIPTVTAVKKEK